MGDGLDLLHHLMPHGHCYYWSPWVLWPSVLAHAVFTIAYAITAWAIGYSWWRWGEGGMLPAVLAPWTAGFVFMCGVSHLFALITIWSPVYLVENVVNLAGAAVSAYAARGMVTVLGAWSMRDKHADDWRQLFREHPELAELNARLRHVLDATEDLAERLPRRGEP